MSLNEHQQKQNYLRCKKFSLILLPFVVMILILLSFDSYFLILHDDNLIVWQITPAINTFRDPRHLWDMLVL